MVICVLGLTCITTNLGKLVSIKSTLGAYFKVPGLTNPTEYKFVE